MLDLKSGYPEFKSRSGHSLDLSQAVTGPTPWLRLYKANWSPASRDSLPVEFHLLYFFLGRLACIDESLLTSLFTFLLISIRLT